MVKLNIKKLLYDIRFWIILFFVIRLFGITNPPLEIAHNWRQTLTNMITRNLLEVDPNILYPRIDMAGDKTGILGSEFPLFNYINYYLDLIFGYTHWYGRLINLIVSSFGVYYFYKLLLGLFSKCIAFNSTIILLSSVWFAFSRKIMPDTFSVSLVIIGLYYGYYYLTIGKRWSLLLFFIFCTLGILCKIPALSLFSVLIIILFIRDIPMSRKIYISVVAVLAFAIACVWYFYWVPYLVSTYEFPLYFPKGMREGIDEILQHIPGLMEKFYFASLHSYVAFLFFILGVFFVFKSKNRILQIALSIISFVFLIFIIKTGEIFPTHTYYIIPYTPVMALIAGYGLSYISISIQNVVLGIIMLESILNQQHDFFINKSQQYKLKLESISDSLIAPNDLIVINGGQSPQDIYFVHRKGWSVDDSMLLSQQYLNTYIVRGAKFLIIDKSHFEDSIRSYPLIYSDNDYDVYDLKP